MAHNEPAAHKATATEEQREAIEQARAAVAEAHQKLASAGARLLIAVCAVAPITDEEQDAATDLLQEAARDYGWDRETSSSDSDYAEQVLALRGMGYYKDANCGKSLGCYGCDGESVSAEAHGAHEQETGHDEHQGGTEARR